MNIGHTYYLFPTAMISRVALQATTSSTGKKSARRDDDYAGDILLRFRHIPSGVHATVEGMLFMSCLPGEIVIFHSIFS